MDVRNVDILPQHYTASQPRRLRLDTWSYTSIILYVFAAWKPLPFLILPIIIVITIIIMQLKATLVTKTQVSSNRSITDEIIS